MIYRIYPQKDTTIYEDSDNQLRNTSNDETLEIRKYYNLNGDFVGNSRVLIQFDLSQISQSLSSNIISGSNIKYFLKLVSAEEKEIPTSYSLEVYPISESWTDGVGRFTTTPKNENDVNWKNRQTNVSWSMGQNSATSSYIINYGGGNWFTSSLNNTKYYQSFNKTISDINLDVTNYVNDILSGSRVNNGFIIKLTDSKEQETNNASFGSAKYFSSNTNTIYSPTLEIRWDNTKFTTGSLS